MFLPDSGLGAEWGGVGGEASNLPTFPGDVKMKDEPQTLVLKGFMAVVYSCTQQNYKKRCTIEEVGM